MLSYGGLEGYGLGSNTSTPPNPNPGPSSSSAAAAATTVYVVLSTLESRRNNSRRHSIQADCVYSNQETAYSHAFSRALEDGGACLDDDGIECLSRIARDMAAMSMPFKESWRRINEFLEAEKWRLDWDVWPRCWVQETQLNVRRETGGPIRVVEGLEYLFSGEAAADSGSEEEDRGTDGGETNDENRMEQQGEASDGKS